MDNQQSNQENNQENEQNSSQQAPVEKASEASEQVSGRIQRRPVLETFFSSLAYINKLVVNDDVSVRDSDKATSYFLLICSLATVVALVTPMLAPQRLPLLLVCDVLVGAMIFMYIAHRLGIITTLTDRQAFLSWQLMQGTFFFGIFITINIALFLGLILTSTHVEMSVAPPH